MSVGPVGNEPAPVPPSATQVFVRMRDGVELATDIYLPESGDAFPTILVRLPYDKNSRYVFMEAVARRATAAGYALVVQDVRGKYRSGGESMGPANEVRDGYDTLQWISAASWSNGRVGMFGDSYYGFTQWAAVSSRHPALRAIVPRVTSSRLPLFELVERGPVRDIPWMEFATYLLQCWSGQYVNEHLPDFTVRPLQRAYDEAFAELGERSAWFDTMIPRTLPIPVYSEGDPFSATPIPVLHTVGWWDNLSVASMRDYTALLASPGWAPLQYLWADSVDHENYHLSEVGRPELGDHNEDDDALERLMGIYIDPALRFFDVFVKEIVGAADMPRVQWHLGHAEYRTSDSWPPAEAKLHTLYLRDLSALPAGKAALAPTPPTALEQGNWGFDPTTLIPGAVENSFAFLKELPDESATSDREDVAVFDSAPFESDTDLAGPIDLWLDVTSTADSADIVAKLYDLSPDGKAHVIRWGSGEYRVGLQAELGRIELGHTGYRIRKGHSLRLHIASSDFPDLPPNPGNGSNRWLAETLMPATHSLRTRPGLLSRLDVHVLSAV